MARSAPSSLPDSSPPHTCAAGRLWKQSSAQRPSLPRKQHERCFSVLSGDPRHQSWTPRTSHMVLVHLTKHGGCTSVLTRSSKFIHKTGSTGTVKSSSKN